MGLFQEENCGKLTDSNENEMKIYLEMIFKILKEFYGGNFKENWKTLKKKNENAVLIVALIICF